MRSGRLWHGEVTVRRLFGRARQWDVCAELHDLVTVAEQRSVQGDNGGIGDELQEPAYPLRIQLDVVAAPAPKGNALTLVHPQSQQELLTEIVVKLIRPTGRQD